MVAASVTPARACTQSGAPSRTSTRTRDGPAARSSSTARRPSRPASMIATASQMVDELELMRRDRTGTPRAASLAQHAREQIGDDRVEPGEGLVEDQQIRAVHERGGELHTLLIALRELLDLGVRPIAQTSRPNQAFAALRACACVRPCSTAKYSSWSPARIFGYSPRSSGM